MSKDLTQNLSGSQDEKLDRIIVAVERLGTRLESLETKVEKRLKDTLPMWEAVQGQLTEIRAEFKADLQELRTEVKADLQEFRTEFKADLEKGFRRLGHTITLYSNTVQDLHADLRDQGERLDKLEKVER